MVGGVEMIFDIFKALGGLAGILSLIIVLKDRR